MSRRRLVEAWSAFWFRPEARTNLAIARVVIAATALWIVLSRYDLPSALLFPREIWDSVVPERKMRFFLFFSVAAERILWMALHVTLTACIAGIATRWAAIVSGLLLYHFSAFETLLWTGNPYLRGFTIPVLGLLIIGASASGGDFAKRADADRASGENRWPLALIQVLFVQVYFFAAWAKLYTSGLEWMHPENIRRYIIAIDQWTGAFPSPVNRFIIETPALAAAIAVGGVVFEASFPLVLISRRARMILLPAAVFFHIANGIVFHIWFQNAWILLIFVDWHGLMQRRRIAACRKSSISYAT